MTTCRRLSVLLGLPMFVLNIRWALKNQAGWKKKISECLSWYYWVSEKYCGVSFFFSEVENSLETLLWSSSDFSGEEECIEGGS